jgi:hypothetical protein
MRVTQQDIEQKAVKRRHMQDKPVVFGLAADRPVHGEKVDIFVWFSTDTNALSCWNGTAWVATTLA